MLAIEIEFLTGRYVATAHDERAHTEWPPHPARLFSALVAEWGTAESPSERERAVLERIESLGPPNIVASGASSRSAVTHYVPVNDPSVIGQALWRRVQKADDAHVVVNDPCATDKQRARANKELAKALDVADLVNASAGGAGSSPLPAHRGRQARQYPSVTPDDPVVVFLWTDAQFEDSELDTLDGLLERVTRLGHSSSLVACRVGATSSAQPTFVPDRSGSRALRTVSSGQLAALEHEFTRHQGSRPRSLPATVTHYAALDEVTPPSTANAARANCSGDWFVFRLEHGAGRMARVPGQATAAVTAALRGALLKHAQQIPEVLHGHGADGRRTDHPHTAFLALPDVGHAHASGQLIGVAVMLPTGLALSSPDRKSTVAAVGRWQAGGGELRLPGGLRLICELDADPTLAGLRRPTWARRSTEWVSATPIALPWRARKPAERANEWVLAAQWIVDSCRHVGLPEPDDVDVTLSPLLSGALPAGRYPAFRQGGSARRLVHARVIFAAPIDGPLVLGSGRFFGLGLMRPVDGGRS